MHTRRRPVAPDATRDSNGQGRAVARGEGWWSGSGGALHLGFPHRGQAGDALVTREELGDKECGGSGTSSEGRPPRRISMERRGDACQSLTSRSISTPDRVRTLSPGGLGIAGDRFPELPGILLKPAKQPRRMPSDGQAAWRRAHQKHDGEENVLGRDGDEKHGDIGRRVVEPSERLFELRNARCVRLQNPVQ